jgi:putative intracellular protease/amidase
LLQGHETLRRYIAQRTIAVSNVGILTFHQPVESLRLGSICVTVRRSKLHDYLLAWMAFQSHIVEDGKSITGQNPASAAGVAEAVVKRLEAGS